MHRQIQRQADKGQKNRQTCRQPGPKSMCKVTYNDYAEPNKHVFVSDNSHKRSVNSGRDDNFYTLDYTLSTFNVFQVIYGGRRPL